jgi:hypothetical protein
VYRRIIMGLGVAVIVAVVALGVVVARRGLSSECEAAAEAGALAGAWDASRREAVRAAFSATGLAYAEDAYSRVQTRLDRYAGGLAAARREACVAGEAEALSAARYDAQVICLERRAAALKALGAALTRADAAAVAQAIQASSALPSIAGCAEAEAAAGTATAEPALAGLYEELDAAEARGGGGGGARSAGGGGGRSGGGGGYAVPCDMARRPGP